MLFNILFVMSIILAATTTCLCVAYYLELKKLRHQLQQSHQDFELELEKRNTLHGEFIDLKTKFTQTVLYDPLTGLPGRQVFEDRMFQTINQSKRYELTFAVLFLDLDGFKIINEALGHDIGDMLLKEVGLRLQKSIRQVDTVSRFGGDKFVFMLPQLSKGQIAAYVAQRILDALAQPLLVDNQELFITGSIGISVYPIDGEDVKTLLKNADNAMHQAKARGRNAYQFYREEMHTLSHRELILSSNLQSNSIYNNFTVHYQPQLNVEKKSIACMQALLVWQHPDFGLIELPEFIRLAENSGKMAEIGEWLIQKALDQLQDWKSKEFFPNMISVTVSARQLESPHFSFKISQLLQAAGVDPGALILEISEGILASKIEVIEKVAHMLKHLGVQIAIADFGTGHLSLQDLKRFPIDYLKISGSLIQDITVNKESEAIVKMIIALAKTLQITVVADGIESQNQKTLLKDIGCVIMQGKLFSVPRPADEFTKGWLNV